MVKFFGKNYVERCIKDKDQHWLNAWGANIHHIRGGLWRIYGHHTGEAEETLNHLRAL